MKKINLPYKKLSNPIKLRTEKNPDQEYIAIDFETFAFEYHYSHNDNPVTNIEGKEHPPPCPPSVCYSITNEEMQSELFACHTEEATDVLAELLADTNVTLITANGSFDLNLVFFEHPNLRTAIFEAYEDGRIVCVQLFEKLMNLAQVGITDDRTKTCRNIPMQFQYDLGSLTKKYLDIDISDEKTGDDIWRLRYKELYQVPISDYPEEAAEYPAHDTEYTLGVFLQQLERRKYVIKSLHHDPLTSLTYQMCKAFACTLVSDTGIFIDEEGRDKLGAEVKEKLFSEECYGKLIANKIMRPAEAPREYKKTPGKFTKGKKESLDTAALKLHILELYEAGVVEDLVLTNKGIELEVSYDPKTPKENRENIKYISTNADFLAVNGDKSEILISYVLRQSVAKILSTELPRLGYEAEYPVDKVYPQFSFLKETGRTSSYASKFFPSLNIQNVGKSIRHLFPAPEGKLILSIDITSLESRAVAQTCLDHLGFSVLADKINAGIDSHAYLGAQIAARKCKEFQGILSELDTSISKKETIYDIFTELKADDEFSHIYGEYRTFAKPANLGLPGGLGAATFVTYAETTYGVIFTEAESKELISLWKEVYYEFNKYFEYFQANFKDNANSTPDQTMYAYTSPMGMRRANTSYCAMANGWGLQSPGAEAYYHGLYYVMRELLDPAVSSPMFDLAEVWATIHDEIDFYVEPQYVEVVNERASAIMNHCLELLFKDIKPQVEPALMDKWSKFADPVYDSEGKLMVWYPKPKK